MASRNANRAASSRDSPRNMPATIVTPSRLMPASSARICADPMITASIQPILDSRSSDSSAWISSCRRIARWPEACAAAGRRAVARGRG